MRLPVVAALYGAGCLVLAGPALAHHSFSMFNYNKPVTWTGTVQTFDWRNPHVKISVLVPKQDGGWESWDIEGASTNIMFRQGWNRLSFAPGDKIKVVGFAMKDGSHAGTLYYAIDPHGKKLYHDINRRPGVG